MMLIPSNLKGLFRTISLHQKPFTLFLTYPEPVTERSVKNWTVFVSKTRGISGILTFQRLNLGNWGIHLNWTSIMRHLGLEMPPRKVANEAHRRGEVAVY